MEQLHVKGGGFVGGAARRYKSSTLLLDRAVKFRPTQAHDYPRIPQHAYPDLRGHAAISMITLCSM